MTGWRQCVVTAVEFFARRYLYAICAAIFHTVLILLLLAIDIAI